MKIMNIKKMLMISIFAGILFSCNNDDSLEDVRTGKPTVTVNPTSTTTTEGMSTTFTLTVDKPISSSMDFKIEVADGSAGSFRDFDCSVSGVPVVETTIDEGGFGQGKIGYILSFPAYASTFSFTITPKIDLLKEGNELLKLRLSSALNGNGLVAPSSEIINMNVADYVSNDVGVELIWDKKTTIHGTIVDTPYVGTDNLDHDTSMFDFDLYILDSGGNPINFDGATSSNPEFVELSSTSPDGDYYVYFELYIPSSGFIRPKVPFNQDVNVIISKYGVWSTTINVPMSTSDTFADAVAIITKTGNTYVVTDYLSGNILASGKFSTAKPVFKRKK